MAEQFTYRQIPTDRNVSSLTSYSGGEIIFRWQTTAGQVWHPSKTVVRARVSLTQGSGGTDGAALALANATGINMDFLACTLNRVQLKCNNKVVSEIEAYVGQVDMMWKRLKKSKAWLDGVGASCESLESSVYDRINKVSSDGKINGITANSTSPLTNNKLQDSLKLRDFECMYKPGMDIFEVPVLGQGNWSLHLFPLSNTSDIQYNAVETIGAKTVATDFRFNLSSLFLDVATSYMPDFVQGPLRLRKITAHVDALTGGTSYSQQTFTVPRNTVALTYAVQSARYGSDSRVSASKMTLPLSAGTGEGGHAEAQLTRLQLQFKGLNAFQSELDPSYDYANNKNFLVEWYNRNLLNTDQYSAICPGETFQDWINRGVCIHAPFNAGPDATGTLATVQYQYAVDPTNGGAETPRIFLFTHEACSVEFSTQGEVIVDSQVVPL